MLSWNLVNKTFFLLLVSVPSSYYIFLILYFYEKSQNNLFYVKYTCTVSQLVLGVNTGCLTFIFYQKYFLW